MVSRLFFVVKPTEMVLMKLHELLLLSILISFPLIIRIISSASIPTSRECQFREDEDNEFIEKCIKGLCNDDHCSNQREKSECIVICQLSSAHSAIRTGLECAMKDKLKMIIDNLAENSNSNDHDLKEKTSGSNQANIKNLTITTTTANASLHIQTVPTTTMAPPSGVNGSNGADKINYPFILRDTFVNDNLQSDSNATSDFEESSSTDESPFANLPKMKPLFNNRLNYEKIDGEGHMIDSLSMEYQHQIQESHKNVTLGQSQEQIEAKNLPNGTVAVVCAQAQEQIQQPSLEQKACLAPSNNASSTNTPPAQSQEQKQQRQKSLEAAEAKRPRVKMNLEDAEKKKNIQKAYQKSDPNNPIGSVTILPLLTMLPMLPVQIIPSPIESQSKSQGQSEGNQFKLQTQKQNVGLSIVEKNEDRERVLKDIWNEGDYKPASMEIPKSQDAMISSEIVKKTKGNLLQSQGQFQSQFGVNSDFQFTTIKPFKSIFLK